MEKKVAEIKYDICQTHQEPSIIITHVNDVDSNIIELTLTKNKEIFELSDSCSASVSFVEQNTRKLIKDNMPCEITENGIIIIPIDNLHFRQQMDIDIEVTITDNSGNQVLTLPFPIRVRVNPSILDDAEVTDDSKGTVPELLEEAKSMVENFDYDFTEEDFESISEALNISGKADKSTTLGGYGIADSYTKSEVNSLVESGIVPDSAVVTAAVNNYLDNHPVDYSDEVSRTVDNILEDLYSVENVSYESNNSILTLSNGYYNLNGEIVDHSAYKHTEKIKVIAGTTLQYSNLRAANNTLPCIACFANGVFSSALSYVPGNTDYASGTFQIPEGITAISLITREAANYPVSITIAEHKSRLTPLSEEVDSLEVISDSLIAQKTIQLTSTDLSWESAYINKNGGITEHSKYHVSELISVIEGTTLNFQNLRAPASGYPYLACYTSNDRTGYVSSKSLIATDSGFETGSLTVPQGIKYISVSIYDLISSSNPFLMEKDVSVNRVDELDDTISKFGANHWSGKRWYAFGTSITDTNNSLGENGTPTGKYAPYLQQMSGMLLSNYGIAGGTIGSGGVHGGTSNILNKIKATDLSAADLITIEGFVNDFACSVPLGDIGDTENTSLYGALTQAVRHCLENSGATVVLITESIGRLYNEADYRTTRKNVINLTQNDYNEAIRNIGKFLGVPVIDAGGLAHINENRPKYLFDHIHHSELGGKQYANAIWSCLKNIPCSE